MALTRITKGVIKPNENYDTHNINSTGIITAIGFKGPFTGSSDIQSGIITATKIDLNGDIDVDGHTNLDNVSISGIATVVDLDVDGHTNLDNVNVAGVTTFAGAISGTTASFSGNVSIGGTLTYEDVTNVDAVGLITARNGIRLGATGANTLITGDANKVTLTSNAHDGGLELLAGNNSQESRFKIQGKAANGTEHNWVIGASRSADRFYVSDTTATRFAILDGGNVGINEVSPDAPLHITGGLPHIRLENSGTSASVGDVLGQIDFKHNDSDDAGVTAAIKCIAEDNAGNSYLTFNNGDGGNADERLRITSAGKVGIGLFSSLIYQLEVKTNSSSLLRINNSGESGHGSHDALIVAGGTYYQNPVIGGSTIKFNTFNGSTFAERVNITSDGVLKLTGQTTVRETAGLTHHTNNNLYIRGGTTGLIMQSVDENEALVVQNTYITAVTAGEERFRIDANGSVGIGTDSPGAACDNRPGLHIHSNHNDSCRLNLTTPTKDNTRIGYFGLNRFGIDFVNGFQLRDSSDSYATRLLIDNNGNMGLGTDSPSDALEISHASDPAIRLHYGSNSGYSVISMDNANNLTLDVDVPSAGSNSFFNVKIDGSEKLHIDSAGNVGIGTDDPNGDLDIVDEDSSARIYLKSGNTADCSIYFGAFDDSATGGIRYDHSDDTLRFMGHNNSQKLYIDANSVIVAGGAGRSLHASRTQAKFGIDCQGLNILDGVNDPSNYGMVFYNDPTTDKANGIGFFNDDGQSCGGYIVHQDRGGSNIGDIIFATSSSANTPVERLRITSEGVLQIKQSTNTNQGIEWYSSGGAKSASIGWGNGNANFEFKNFRQDAQADGPYGNVDFFTGSSTNPGLKLRIQVTGEIGTNGVTNPTALLHMGGTNNFIRLGTATLGGETKAIADIDGHPYLSGTPWYNTSTYDYDTSDSPHMDYYWIKIVESLGGSAIGYIEYMAHGDSNYPRSVHGFLDVAKYSNGSLSISHSQHSQQAGTVQCVVDSNEDIWLRFHGFDWNSDMRYRLVYGESVSMNSDFTVNGTSGNRIRNSEGGPPNMSYDIVPGATLRWNLSNSNPPKAQYGSTESQTAGTYGLNPSYATYSKRLGKVQCAGKIEGTAGWNDGGIYVTSNGIDVNGAQQPVTAIFRSQKNTVVEFNRMYTQGTMLQFKQNNDNRGYFNNSGTTTTYYDQGSDERLKTNFEEWSEEVLPHFKSLKPKKFNWIEDAAGTPKVKGFIAQENLDKFPEAYHLNEDDRYWFSKSEMVPYLMKALQEEIVKREEIEAKYNALEARIAALESS